MKPLTIRIAERVSKTYPPSSATANLAAFILQRDEIKKAIAGGWSLLSIWKTLHDEGAIGFGYQSFRRYAIRLIQEKPDSIPNEQ